MDRLDMDGVGCGAYFARVREHADGSYDDEWGVTYLANTEVVAHPIRGPIRTLADARAYTPPDPDHPDRLGKLPDLVRRYKGRRAILFHHRAALMWSAYLLGIDNLLMDFLAQPELAEIVLDKVLGCNMRVVRRAIRAGAEVIILGDDYAGNHGPMMSPADIASTGSPLWTTACDNRPLSVRQRSSAETVPAVGRGIMPDGVHPTDRRRSGSSAVPMDLIPLF